jgi:hypothetical protein
VRPGLPVTEDGKYWLIQWPPSQKAFLIWNDVTFYAKFGVLPPDANQNPHLSKVFDKILSLNLQKKKR